LPGKIKSILELIPDFYTVKTLNDMIPNAYAHINVPRSLFANSARYHLILLLYRWQREGSADSSFDCLPESNVLILVPGKETEPGLDIVM
jgi:hypothetical protein